MDFVKITGFPNNCNLSAVAQPADGPVSRARAGAHVQAGGHVDNARLVQGGIRGIRTGLSKADIVLGNKTGPGTIFNFIEAAGGSDNGDGSSAGQRTDTAILSTGAGAHIQAGGLNGSLLGIGDYRIAALLQIAAGDIACKAVRLNT